MTNDDTPNGKAPSTHPLRAAADHLTEVAERTEVAQLGGPKIALAAIRTVNHGFFTSAQATMFLNNTANLLEALAAGRWPEVAA